jgi:tetratricopeptide (TPR) repeat protein
MAMIANIQLQKALLYLDRGLLEKGEDLLRSSIRSAYNEGDEIAEVQACCALGDLLCELGQWVEAKQLLERVVSVQRDDDVLEMEVLRARELLNVMRQEPGRTDFP